MKKGFLSDAKKPLYPKGSEQARRLEHASGDTASAGAPELIL